MRQGTRVPELRIELVQGARVQGRVRGGKVSMMALVRADGFKTVVAFVTPRGEFAFNGVPPGR